MALRPASSTNVGRGPVSTVLADDEVAVLFRKDGTFDLLVPKFKPNDKVPRHVLAATEVMLRAHEEGQEALANSFRERSAESH